MWRCGVRNGNIAEAMRSMSDRSDSDRLRLPRLSILPLPFDVYFFLFIIHYLLQFLSFSFRSLFVFMKWGRGRNPVWNAFTFVIDLFLFHSVRGYSFIYWFICIFFNPPPPSGNFFSVTLRSSLRSSLRSLSGHFWNHFRALTELSERVFHFFPFFSLLPSGVVLLWMSVGLSGEHPILVPGFLATDPTGSR